MESDFFHAKVVGGRVAVAGLPSCRLGDKLDFSTEYGPEGIFAEWEWDGSRFALRTDRYGFYPLYYFVRPGEFAVSNSIPRLASLGASLELDESAISVFLRLGFFIGADTPFKYIRAIPPASRFEWSNGESVTVEAWPNSPRIREIGRDEAIDAYISLFRTAMRRRHPPDGNFAVPLSGGRDSRHILLELLRNGHPPKYCLTARYYPSADCADVEVAGSLASVFGLHHIVLDQAKSRFRPEFRKNLLTNFCADEHFWFLAVADYLNDRSSAVYDGIGGDVLSGGLFLTPRRLELYRAGRLRDLALALWSDDRELVLARMLTIEQYRRFGKELAVEKLAEELKLYVTAPNPVGAFYFANRTRREIVLPLYRILNKAGIIFTPYLDHELYDFLASLPGSMLVDKEFHSAAIRRAYPEYAGIRYAGKPDSELPPWSYFQRFALELLWFSFRRRPSRFVRGAYLLPRLARCLAGKRYSAELHWFGPLVLYLVQLERFVGSRVGIE